MNQKVPYRRIYATVDLDAVAHNMKMMKESLADGVGILGVVKTDGYGHGAVPVARAMEPYVEGYAVATAQEALQLWRHRIKKMILILGPIPESYYPEIIRLGIRVPVFTWKQAKALSEKAVLLGRDAVIHLALDTGMNRIGMKPTLQSVQLVEEISKLPGIQIEGLFTHFAKADEEDKTATRRQMERYEGFCRMLEERGINIPIRHLSNSAAILDMPEVHCNMVRAGIASYGLYPSDEVDQRRISLKPALSLNCFITYMKEIEPGDEVSYGGHFVAEKPMRIATISVGYGDGYPRSLSGKGRVLIHGKSAPILGRVCMDQTMVDVTEIPEAMEGDTVTLIGTDGDERISVEEVEKISGGFRYEIICGLGKRVPKVFVENQQIVGTKDYFHDLYEEFL